MKKPRNALGTLGILASAVLMAGISTGCGGTKTGGTAGAGGNAGGSGNGQGGATGGGGSLATGGTTATGTGGIGTGGIGVGGTSGKATGGTGGGELGTGGAMPGTSGKGTGGIGTGGIGTGGTGPSGTSGTGGMGAGGSGAGGKATGGTGTGGTATGGATSLDAGSADAPAAKCSELATRAACDVRADCHPVFRSEQNCACASLGCCTTFSKCADGAKADCTGPALCEMMTPYCEAPYVVAYTNSCYEGCVAQSDCPPPTCPQSAPKNATACGPVGYSCFYEDCAGAGRTQAVCTAGAWKVESAACTALPCEGGGITPYSLTCDAGKVCVRTTGGGGAYIITPMCVNHSCGTGPMSLQCIQGLSGSCSATYQLTGAVVSCSAPSACGSGQGGCA